MRKITAIILCALMLAACSREQVQNGIGASIRQACQNHDENCAVHCGAGEAPDRSGQCFPQQ